MIVASHPIQAGDFWKSLGFRVESLSIFVRRLYLHNATCLHSRERWSNLWSFWGTSMLMDPSSCSQMAIGKYFPYIMPSDLQEP